MLLVFKDLPKTTKKIFGGEKPVIWNTKKANGWENYTKFTEENDKLKGICDEVQGYTTSMMKKITNELDKAIFETFGGNKTQ